MGFGSKSLQTMGRVGVPFFWVNVFLHGFRPWVLVRKAALAFRNAFCFFSFGGVGGGGGGGVLSTPFEALLVAEALFWNGWCLCGGSFEASWVHFERYVAF